MLNTRGIKIRRIGSPAPYTSDLVAGNSSYKATPPILSRVVAAAIRLSHVLSRPALPAAILGFCYLGFAAGYLLGGNADSSGALVTAIVGVALALVWAASPELCGLAEGSLVVLVGRAASTESWSQVAAWTVSIAMRDVRSPHFHSSVISVLSPVPHFSRLAHMYSRELDDHVPGSPKPSSLVLPYALSLGSTPAILSLSDALPTDLKPSLTSLAILSGKRWSAEGLEVAAAMAPSWSGDLSDLLLAAESLV